jgi:hypothetical protein
MRSFLCVIERHGFVVRNSDHRYMGDDLDLEVIDERDIPEGLPVFRRLYKPSPILGFERRPAQLLGGPVASATPTTALPARTFDFDLLIGPEGPLHWGSAQVYVMDLRRSRVKITAYCYLTTKRHYRADFIFSKEGRRLLANPLYMRLAVACDEE